MRWWKINGNARSGTDWVDELRERRVTHWVTRAPPGGWAVGDGVFCWRSGAEHGFVGLARITKIASKPTPEGEVRYHLDYLTPPFSHPIDLAALRAHPDLSPHADRWLKQMQGVTEVERAEAEALAARIAADNPSAADVLRGWGLLSDLFHRCVYTIVDPAALLAAHHRGEPISEKKRWVTVARWRVEETPQKGIAVLFADAGWVDEVLYWGRLSDLRVDAAGTHLRVDDLRWVSGRFKTELIVAETGEPLAEGHRRPYVICETPAWLHTARQGPVSPAASDDPSPARAFFERIEDGARRRRVMQRLADAIDRADAVSGQWGITISRKRGLDFLRLNIGITEAFVVWVAPDGGVVVNVLAAPELVSRASRRGFRHERPYPSADGAMLWSWEQAGETMRDLCAIEGAVEAAFRAAHRRTYPHQGSHEPSVTAYLTAVLGRALPTPVWQIAPTSQPAPPSGAAPAPALAPMADEGEASVAMRAHFHRERSLRLSKLESTQRERGALACEACGFDFARAFGEAGKGYIQVHHTLPLASRGADAPTSLDDLVLLCANCHVMAHHRRGDSPRSVPELKALIEKGGSRA